MNSISCRNLRRARASKFHPEHLDGDHTLKNKVLGLKNDTRSAPSNFSDETVSIRERGLENL